VSYRQLKAISRNNPNLVIIDLRTRSGRTAQSVSVSEPSDGNLKNSVLTDLAGEFPGVPIIKSPFNQNAGELGQLFVNRNRFDDK
jgi:hypothetical protein